MLAMLVPYAGNLCQILYFQLKIYSIEGGRNTIKNYTRVPEAGCVIYVCTGLDGRLYPAVKWESYIDVVGYDPGRYGLAVGLSV